VGWDWFSLQFDDRTELMAYLLRQADGRFSPASSGTFVDESGRATHLPFDTLRLQVLDTWRSARSGARYPARWRLDIPLLRLSLEIVPTVADQEMRTAETTGITYWEGSAAATGSSRGRTVSGTGYVELTGYQEAMGDRL
jgi:predicted secreted hydrolase